MGNFIADYGTEIVAAIAAANGIIALAMGQLFKRRPCVRVLLVVVATLLSVSAVGAAFYKRHIEIARREQIHTQLGKFIREGLTLMSKCSDKNDPVSWKKTQEWRGEIEAFLRADLDESYVNRLADPAGVPLNVDCRNAADAEHSLAYQLQFRTNFRLEEFSREANF